MTRFGPSIESITFPMAIRYSRCYATDAGLFWKYIGVIPWVTSHMGAIPWVESRMGAIPWVESRMGAIPCVESCMGAIPWVESYMGAIQWVESHMGAIPLVESCMGAVPCRFNSNGCSSVGCNSVWVEYQGYLLTHRRTDRYKNFASKYIYFI